MNLRSEMEERQTDNDEYYRKTSIIIDSDYEEDEITTPISIPNRKQEWNSEGLNALETIIKRDQRLSSVSEGELMSMMITNQEGAAKLKELNILKDRKEIVKHTITGLKEYSDNPNDDPDLISLFGEVQLEHVPKNIQVEHNL
jgi:hypothetical protein